MGLRSEAETRQPRSQATPLAEDVLGILRKQVTGGTFGTGFGPLQQQAGTAIQQFVNSGAGGRFESGTLPQVRDINLTPVDIASQVGTLEGIQQRSSQRALADVRETVGAQGGGRFGTGVTRAVGDTARDLELGFTAQLDQLLRDQQGLQLGAQQAGVQRDLAVGNQQLSQDQLNMQGFEQELARILNALVTMQGFGVQNMAPIFGIASQGILPEETIIQDGWGKTLLQTFSQLAPLIPMVMQGQGGAPTGGGSAPVTMRNPGSNVGRLG